MGEIRSKSAEQVNAAGGLSGAQARANVRATSDINRTAREVQSQLHLLKGTPDALSKVAKKFGTSIESLNSIVDDQVEKSKSIVKADGEAQKEFLGTQQKLIKSLDTVFKSNKKINVDVGDLIEMLTDRIENQAITEDERNEAFQDLTVVMKDLGIDLSELKDIKKFTKASSDSQQKALDASKKEAATAKQEKAKADIVARSVKKFGSVTTSELESSSRLKDISKSSSSMAQTASGFASKEKMGTAILAGFIPGMEVLLTAQEALAETGHDTFSDLASSRLTKRAESTDKKAEEISKKLAEKEEKSEKKIAEKGEVVDQKEAKAMEVVQEATSNTVPVTPHMPVSAALSNVDNPEVRKLLMREVDALEDIEVILNDILDEYRSREGEKSGGTRGNKGKLFGEVAGGTISKVLKGAMKGLGLGIATAFTVHAVSELTRELDLFYRDKKDRDKAARLERASREARKKLAQRQLQKTGLGDATITSTTESDLDTSLMTKQTGLFGMRMPNIVGMAGALGEKLGVVSKKPTTKTRNLAKWLARHPEIKKRLIAEGALDQSKDGALSLGANAEKFGIKTSTSVDTAVDKLTKESTSSKYESEAIKAEEKNPQITPQHVSQSGPQSSSRGGPRGGPSTQRESIGEVELTVQSHDLI